jgi:hypothetical protein
MASLETRNDYIKKILVLLFMAVPLFAHSQLEVYGKYTPGEPVQPIVNYFASKKITDEVSFTFFGFIRQKWSQALVGIGFSPTNTFNLVVSAGIEHGTSSPRYGLSIWKEKGKFSLLVLGELGAGNDNYLYKLNIFRKCSDRFTFGVTAWRFHGVGPNFRISVKNLSTTFWSMPAYDFEFNTARMMIGTSTAM